ncbi:hypothetical protein PTT_13542, partial [Pyrenophora teres f. teres 0-1]
KSASEVEKQTRVFIRKAGIARQLEELTKAGRIVLRGIRQLKGTKLEAREENVV